MGTTRTRAGSLYALEPMRLEDIPEVIAIEKASFSNPWSHKVFEQEIKENPCSYPMVARTKSTGEPSLAGYCVLWVMSEHLHIQNIAVAFDHQRRGLGRLLLMEAIELGRRAGVGKACLEVRMSNRAAQRLYLSLGFKQVEKRKGYYTRPSEDAILFEKEPLGARSPRVSKLANH
jgi:ribosomal-protein-alanine N-acetyltransferase